MWNQRRPSIETILLMIICLELYFLDFRISSNRMNNEAYTISIPLRQAMSGAVHLSQDDPRLVKYILDKGLLVPPSKLPYNLTSPNKDYGGRWGVQPPMTVIRKVLRELNMTDGNRFFVECGAYDGETLSNTLHLEKFLGWKGLLVEGTPRDYESLKRKNRKAWLAKACLAMRPYPHRVRYRVDTVRGTVLQPETRKSRNITEVEVQCIPLFTLLSAIRVRTIDYFSLDVDGNELKVLKTIPFDKVFIKTLTVEHIRDSREILAFMKTKGYVEIGKTKFPKSWPHDFLFVHNRVMKK